MRKSLLLAFSLSLLSGCLYNNTRIPRSYRSATPSDVKTSPNDETATGQGCSKYVIYLFGWGDAGFAAATRDALKDKPEGSILYDVKSDMKATAFLLGIYTKICTTVTGKVAKP